MCTCGGEGLDLWVKKKKREKVTFSWWKAATNTPF